MIDSLNVGVSSWIIQDGNYEDFTVGDRTKFALEFYAAKDLRPAKAGQTIHLTHREAEHYDIVGPVTFLGDRVWVIDAGIQLFREDRPPKLPLGTLVQGTVYLGIDPFFYKEYLKDLPGLPNLFYDIEITGILLETTPWVTSFGSKQRRRGPRSFKRIDRTNADHDDDGNGHYILESRLLGPAAEHQTY